MSFNDLERGDGPGPGPVGISTVAQTGEDKAFTKLKDSVAIQIFKIQSNVEGIQRLVDKLGTKQDGSSLRTSLHNLTEATRDMVKKSTDDIKKVAAWPSETTNGPSRKPIQAKLSKDFTSSLSAFQKVSRLSAEKQKIAVETQKRNVDAALELQEEARSDSDERGQLLQMDRLESQQQVVEQIPEQDLQFQETMIAEREHEIREIEEGIHELNTIFRDLGTIVVEQGGMLDNIESNITSVAQNTSSAAEELTTAHEYQRKAGRRMLCLMLILAVVAGVVLTAILV